MEGEEGLPMSNYKRQPSKLKNNIGNNYNNDQYAWNQHADENNYNGDDVENRPRGQQSIDQLHLSIQQLQQDEKMLLTADGMSAEEKREIQQQFSGQQMSLISQLPPEERVRYESGRGQMRRPSQQIYRMGTLRDNVNMEEEVEYRPYFCVIVLIVNVVLFLVTMAKADWELEKMSINPLIGPPTKVLIDMGAKDATLIRRGDWWRLIAPMFLHAGIIHLLMNMVVLLRLGWSLEVAFGWFRIGMIYMSCGIFGNIVSAMFLPQIPTVGASGALFGLIGALFGDFIQNHKTIQEGKWSYFLQLVISTAIGLAIGLLPLLDNFNHIGGWLFGVLGGMSFLAGAIKDMSGKRVTTWYTTPLVIISLLLQIAAFLVCLAVLYSSINPDGWCRWCKQVSCLDTPWWNCDITLCNTFTNGTTICTTTSR